MANTNNITPKWLATMQVLRARLCTIQQEHPDEQDLQGYIDLATERINEYFDEISGNETLDKK